MGAAGRPDGGSLFSLEELMKQTLHTGRQDPDELYARKIAYFIAGCGRCCDGFAGYDVTLPEIASAFPTATIRALLLALARLT
jgi:hypothetical protein